MELVSLLCGLPNLCDLFRTEFNVDRLQVFFQVLGTEQSGISSRVICKKREKRTLIFFVPGIGMMFCPWARIQARQTWPAVALCFVPIFWRQSTNFSKLGKFSSLNLRTKEKVSISENTADITKDILLGHDFPKVAFRNIGV